MINLLTNRVNKIINKYVTKSKTKLKTLTNTRKLATKLFKWLEDKIKGILRVSPNSLADYIKVGRTYIAKKLILAILVLTLVVVFLFTQYAFPWLEGRFWVPNLVVNSDKYHAYSGKAKVFTKSGKLVYAGEMDQGRISGQGDLYDLNGNLVYRGSFQMEQYSGLGEQFAPKGNLLYKGQFNNNLYDGKGELYNANGTLSYKGMFASGKFEGTGTYYEHGEKVYTGNFSNGLYEGVGSLYHPNGNLKYSGTFRTGKMYGEGKLYNEAGQLIYQGKFLEGLYYSTGIQYEPESSQVIYEGEFKEGQYHGIGKLFNQITGRLRYKGEFKEGLFSGQGTLNNDRGQAIFTGQFFEGEIDYAQYSNSEAQQIREAFGPEDEAKLLEKYFVLFYRDLDVAFIFNYAGTENPKVYKIVFLGDQKVYSVAKGMRLKDLTATFGEPYSDVEYIINDEKENILHELKGIKLENLYGVKFILREDIFLRCYFSESSGEVVYFEIGEV